VRDPLFSAFEKEGFAWLRGAVPEPVLAELRTACARGLASRDLFRRRQTGVYDIRRAVAELPEIGRAARELVRLDDVAPLLAAPDRPARLVKAGFYDKGPGENWSLPWHQDTSIGVRRRLDVEGFGPWYERDSLIYAGAPAAVLERILVVRLHLDPCDAASGAMEVIPGSHRAGRLDAESLAATAVQGGPGVCVAAAGDLLLSRPLLLHRSPPASAESAARHRRVLHFEYSAAELPGGLEWWESGELC
jgi:hypothetical protein